MRRALFTLALSACLPHGGTPPERPVLDPDRVQRGGILFLSRAVSGDGSRSCATCHPGGGTDGRVYRGAEEVPAGTPDGRDVPALWGLWLTPPYMADGSADSVGQVIDRMLRVEMRGGALEEADRSALEAYLLSIPPYDRGRLDDAGWPIEPATRDSLAGARVFRDARCTRCHPPPTYTRPERFDVGTGGKFGIPSLRGLSETGPYGHDGRWETLEEAVRGILDGRGETLPSGDLRRLLRFLRLL